jgi:hypothetical protein
MGALVLGIIGMVAWFIPLLGFPITICGLIWAAKGMSGEKNGLFVAGLVLNIIGLVLTVGNSVLGIYYITMQDSDAYVEPPTIEQLEKAIAGEIDQGFRSRTGISAEIAQAVETAHVTVTVNNGRVLQCRLDGTEGNYIVNLLVDVSWDGILHKGGHTKVFLSLDAESVREFRIVETDAAVNT